MKQLKKASKIVSLLFLLFLLLGCGKSAEFINDQSISSIDLIDTNKNFVPSQIDKRPSCKFVVYLDVGEGGGAVKTAKISGIFKAIFGQTYNEFLYVYTDRFELRNMRMSYNTINYMILKLKYESNRSTPSSEFHDYRETYVSHENYKWNSEGECE